VKPLRTLGACALFAFLAAAGCNGGDAPEKPNKSTDSTAPTAGAASNTGTAANGGTASNGGTGTEPETTLDTPEAIAADEQRRFALFQQRPAVRLPPELPRRWHEAVEALGARVVSAVHGVRSGEPRAYRELQVELRMFGHDATIDQKINTALAGLGLQSEGAPLPEGEQRKDGQRWTADVGRFKAGAGQPREHRLSLSWREDTPPVDELRPCKRPPPVDVPTGTPDWLAKSTLNQSTRRRVVARSAQVPDSLGVTLVLLYQNGYAHDGHVGSLAKAAAAAGLTERAGEGPRQVFSGGGRSLMLAPDNSELNLGCILAGPALRLSYTETQAPKP
jgi:hypothetical protein